MPTENPYLDGTGSFVSTATNAGTVKFASFDDSAVNTGVIAVSATFTGTAVNSGVIGDVFPTQYATFLANNSANWDSTYNTVSDLSATWSAGGGGGGSADLTAISDVSSSWDAAFTFVSLNSSSLVDTNDSRLSDDRTPVAHNHSISEVTGLQTALDSLSSSIGSSSSSSSSSTSVKTLTATSYTLLASDANNVIRYNSLSNTILTIPANVMSVGSQITLVQIGIGKIITTADVGVTRLSPNGATKTVAQYAVASLIQTSENEWLLTGDVS
jgi:hypothetical protein